MKEKRYSISEASRLLEVENHVLRYWEEELELTIPRNELGHRYYREEEIQLLNCIKELKNKGFQLKAVKEVLPDLEQKKLIDVHKLLATQVELENMGVEEDRPEADGLSEDGTGQQSVEVSDEESESEEFRIDTFQKEDSKKTGGSGWGGSSVSIVPGFSCRTSAMGRWCFPTSPFQGRRNRSTG